MGENENESECFIQLWFTLLAGLFCSSSVHHFFLCSSPHEDQWWQVLSIKQRPCRPSLVNTQFCWSGWTRAVHVRRDTGKTMRSPTLVVHKCYVNSWLEVLSPLHSWWDCKIYKGSQFKTLVLPLCLMGQSTRKYLSVVFPNMKK